MTHINITRTLLEKTPEELSDDEKAAVAAYNETRESNNKMLVKKNARIVKDCKILCSGYEHNPIPDYGWIHPVEKLCYKLEGMNYDYAKYGIRVVLDQAKEKYRTLRFYTHIDSDYVGVFGGILRFLDAVGTKLPRKINFRMERVVDAPAYKSVLWNEMTKEQFDTRTNRYGDSLGNDDEVVKVDSRSRVTDFTQLENKVYIVEEDGKFYYSSLLHHMERSHLEPTRHKFMFWMFNKLRDMTSWLSMLYKAPLSQTVKMTEFDFVVDELTRQAERECEKLCQHCGVWFNDYDKKCETQGWYMYVCERCAMASGMEYRLGKKFYKEGVPVDRPEISEADADNGDFEP